MRDGRLGRVATAVLVVALFGYIGLTLFGRFLGDRGSQIQMKCTQRLATPGIPIEAGSEQLPGCLRNHATVSGHARSTARR